MTKYLLCTDGSADAEKATNQLLRLLRPEDSVWLFTAYSIPTEFLLDSFTTEAIVVGDHDAFATELDERKNTARSILHNVRHTLQKLNVVHMNNVHDLLVECDNVKQEIVNKAKQLNVDVVVVGTRGLGTLSRLLLGSVSSYVIENAPCSVFVVR